MDPIERLKDITSLIQKVGDIELYRSIVELQGEVVKLSARNFELERKCTEMQAELNRKKALKHTRGIYFSDDDPIPYCPKCLEEEGKLIHMFECRMADPSVSAWDCSTCEFRFAAKQGEYFKPRELKFGMR